VGKRRKPAAAAKQASPEAEGTDKQS
jgi:hypothetical protein